MSRGWELAAAVVGVALAVTVLAALAGVGIAAAGWGGGWVWPDGAQAISAAIAGLLRGEPTSGFPEAQRVLLASAPLTYTSIGASEAVIWASAGTFAVVVQRRLLPNDARSGMATRDDARRALGVGQLRAAAMVTRPDLHPPRD